MGFFTFELYCWKVFCEYLEMVVDEFGEVIAVLTVGGLVQSVEN